MKVTCSKGGMVLYKSLKFGEGTATQRTLKIIIKEKQMLDKIRIRNGNLNITCSRTAAGKEEL